MRKSSSFAFVGMIIFPRSSVNTVRSSMARRISIRHPHVLWRRVYLCDAEAGVLVLDIHREPLPNRAMRKERGWVNPATLQNGTHEIGMKGACFLIVFELRGLSHISIGNG